jgi:hypothetical protein
MNGILDSIKARPKVFSPQSVREYTALQLAKKLGDTDQLWNYLSLFERHSSQVILEAFASAQESRLTGRELITVFEESLAALTQKEQDDEF